MAACVVEGFAGLEGDSFAQDLAGAVVDALLRAQGKSAAGFDAAAGVEGVLAGEFERALDEERAALVVEAVQDEAGAAELDLAAIVQPAFALKALQGDLSGVAERFGDLGRDFAAGKDFSPVLQVANPEASVRKEWLALCAEKRAEEEGA